MRILFCGCIYGAGNIGDDAILEGLITEFRNIDSNIQIGAISLTPEHTKQVLNIENVWKNDFRSENEAIKWSTHIILGGATLITENPIIKYPLKHCCRIIDHAIAKKKPISMLGVGASNIRTDRARKLFKNYYNKYLDIITVRSEFDRHQAITKGKLNSELLKIGADGAFSLKTSAIWQPKNIIGVSLVSEGNDHIGYPERIVKAINSFQSDFSQFAYEGVCSETRKAAHFDYPLIKETLDSVNGEWKIQDDYKSPQDFIQYLSKFNFVFTMRMHILVFCSLAGIPCVTMIREQKMENMLNSLGMQEYLTMNSSESEILEKFKLAVNQPEKFLADASNLKNLKVLAKNNAILWFETNKNTDSSKTSQVPWFRRCIAKYNTSLIKNITRAYLGQLKLFLKKIINK
jgi:polysaccharide pyruvyl transferase WcaK-like protein